MIHKNDEKSKGKQTKEFEVEVKIYNNCLKERRVNLGFSQKQIAELCGMHYTTYIALESIKCSPVRRNGDWKKSVLSLSWFHRTLPEDLFPDTVLAIKKSKTNRKLSAQEMERLLPEKYWKQLKSDFSMEDVILRSELKERFDKAFGILAEEEIAEKLCIDIERVWNIEMKVLRLLRQPNQSKHLMEFSSLL